MPSELLDWLIQHEPSFRKIRIPSLYSDLSVQRATNADGYAANIAAWQAALNHAAAARQLPTHSPFTLAPTDAFLAELSSPQYGRPLGLGAVVDESIRGGAMVPAKEFVAAERSIYSKTWVPSPWAVLQWGLQQIGLAGSAGTYEAAGGKKLKAARFVLVEALEKVAAEVVGLQEKGAQGLTDRVMSREAFARDLAKILQGANLSDEDLSILLKYLERDKRVLSYDEKTIKFKSPAAASPEPVTIQDTTIASLKSLISSLTTQCSTISSRITSLSATASASVKSGNRVSALSALRSKKLAENTLQQRSATLHQLEEVFAKIEQAADQVEIVHVMEASAGVLKGLNRQVGGVEGVDEVVEKLRDEMSKVDEVGQVLNEPLTSAADASLDEAEIDDELAAMEEEQRRQTEAREAEATRKRIQELEMHERIAKANAEAEARRRVEEQQRVEAHNHAAMEAVEAGVPPVAAGGAAAVDQQPNDPRANSVEESLKRLSQMSIDDNNNKNDAISSHPLEGTQHQQEQPQQQQQQQHEERRKVPENM